MTPCNCVSAPRVWVTWGVSWPGLAVQRLLSVPEVGGAVHQPRPRPRPPARPAPAPPQVLDGHPAVVGRARAELRLAVAPARVRHRVEPDGLLPAPGGGVRMPRLLAVQVVPVSRHVSHVRQYLPIKALVYKNPSISNGLYEQVFQFQTEKAPFISLYNNSVLLSYIVK